MKILVVIDSFKGSMTSKEANETVKLALPKHEVETIPIADGGEGTVETLIELLKGEVITKSITGPNGSKMNGTFGWVENEKIAIIEVAEGAGITKIPTNTLNPKKHTSYGVGEQIISALDLGAKEIIIGLGGSATVDGGIGLLQALGVRFFDMNHKLLPLLPINLDAVAKIDKEKLDTRMKEIKITIASDVTNPLCGLDGATYIFGPQKGLQLNDLASFEEGMDKYKQVVNETTKTSKEMDLGAGAAGGIGFALFSFFNATFESGLSLIAQKGRLAEKIQQVDLVITGEGKFDIQSLRGKTTIGISRMAKEKNVPVIVFSGSIEGDITKLPEENVVAIIPIVDKPISLEEAIKKGPELLRNAVIRTFLLLDLAI